jgi:hypothetical protein
MTSLESLSFQKAADIHNLLVNMFAKYGEILKMGIYVSHRGKWFTGRGYKYVHIK